MTQEVTEQPPGATSIPRMARNGRSRGDKLEFSGGHSISKIKIFGGELSLAWRVANRRSMDARSTGVCTKKGSGRNGNKREEIELSEFQMRNEGPKRLGSRNSRGIASDVKKKWDYLEL